tara:strand:+ start:609 stop:1247 length:639 start_codon:yes stop_codon:yes gene_type:complete
MKSLAKAVISVMKEVKGMEKNSRVGSGGMAYNGTKDQDVKEVFNEALAKHGLCMIPFDIQEETQVDRWEEETTHGKKQKQSVFTKAVVKYNLLHESGESIVVCGYGHGVDPQDKGAGKATTYAMKNALLYTFITPVGKIDDTETTHSNDVAVAPKPTNNKSLDIGTVNWDKVMMYVSKNKDKGLEAIVSDLERKYKLTAKVKGLINEQINNK